MLNLGILLELLFGGRPLPGLQAVAAGAVLKAWPSRHYWEADVSNSWVCLGAYRREPPSRRPPAPQHRLSAGPQSLLVVPGVGLAKFSAGHNNTQRRVARRLPPHAGVDARLRCGLPPSPSLRVAAA